jgi:hypothetical protein
MLPVWSKTSQAGRLPGNIERGSREVSVSEMQRNLVGILGADGALGYAIVLNRPRHGPQPDSWNKTATKGPARDERVDGEEIGESERKAGDRIE